MSSTTDFVIDLEQAVTSYFSPSRLQIDLGFYRFLFEHARFSHDPEGEAKRVISLWTDGTGLDWILSHQEEIDISKILI